MDKQQYDSANGEDQSVLKIDGQTRKALDLLEADPFLDPVNMTPAEMRMAFDQFYAKIDLPEEAVDVINTSFAGPTGPVPVRLYRPLERRAPLPVALYIKGGGLIMGTLDSYDRICRRLCVASGALIVSVAYRQPPEHRHPAAAEDCFAALSWIYGAAAEFGGNPGKLAVVGESGGGLLAAVVTHMAHDRGGPDIDYQVLIYPAIGSRVPSKSMSEFSRGYWFEPEALDWLYSQYVESADQMHDPRVSPTLRSDLSGLPPAYVVVANFDILRDDIEDYAQRLEQAGVPVETVRYPTIHGFMNMGAVIDLAGAAVDACGSRLADALGAGAA